MANVKRPSASLGGGRVQKCGKFEVNDRTAKPDLRWNERECLCPPASLNVGDPGPQCKERRPWKRRALFVAGYLLFNLRNHNIPVVRKLWFSTVTLDSGRNGCRPRLRSSEKNPVRHFCWSSVSCLVVIRG